MILVGLILFLTAIISKLGLAHYRQAQELNDIKQENALLTARYSQTVQKNKDNDWTYIRENLSDPSKDF